VEFETDWKTLGKHRVRLRATRGFPTETLHTVADVGRLAIENNMSARARLVEVVYRDQDKAYDILYEPRCPMTGATRRSSKLPWLPCWPYCPNRSQSRLMQSSRRKST
jgi:hypothetical protein